ncbi:MAG: 2-amino-4-hydroxy-6-hydroxymethyldihydropteridine diphosphokinase [Candidatus Gracilibacteria bacterium]
MPHIFLSLGSNLGDREKAMNRAQSLLEGFNVRFLKMSPLYETEPVCPVKEDCEQPWFLNAVAEVETDHAPVPFLLLCREVESRLGRDTKDYEGEDSLLRRYFPRPMDIDVLMYDDLIKESKLLILPHPRFHLRRYVLQPFCDIAPDIVHPVEKKTIAQLLKNVKDDACVKKFSHGS